MGAAVQLPVEGELPSLGSANEWLNSTTFGEPRTIWESTQRGRIAEHVVEITFLDPGVQAYVFTFG